MTTPIPPSPPVARTLPVIEFFDRETGEVRTNHEYFVLNGEVCRDNYNTYESQCAVIGFEDCIVRVPEIGWRVPAISAHEAEVGRLREALNEIADMTDPDGDENYRSDDREGCLDAVFAAARAALTQGETK